jgi:predicted DNA-binding transcriptional regulator
MGKDQITGWMILLGSILGIIVYFYLVFLSPWTMLTIQISAFIAVAALLSIMAWIGYTLATTPPPTPIEDLDILEQETEPQSTEQE